MAKTRVVYFVRGGTHHGAYLKLREAGNKKFKYAWTPYKDRLVEMTYNQARHAVKGVYGGNLIKRVYKGKSIIKETTVV